MWCRKRIDIGWRDLLNAWGRTYRSPPSDTAQREAESALFSPDESLATLSVRSGFDLLLQVLALPPGSEVLMSAVTITDMARIVEEHGLVPVPIDLNPATMMPEPDVLRKAITENSRAVLVAQLFGAITEMTPLIDICRSHNLLFIEDCAQAFDGRRYCGHPDADVVMFSFGPIKTATALAGGLLRVHDKDLLDRMRTAHAAWPQQPTVEYRKRIRSFALLKLISGRLLFGLLMRLIRLRGRDPDTVLNGAVRNFPADTFFTMLRRRPCPALLRTLARRLERFDVSRQNRRAQVGAELSSRLEYGDAGPQPLMCPSSACPRHTWWVMPVVPPPGVDRQHLLRTLARHGFDATAGSQMKVISGGDSGQPSNVPAVSAVVEGMLFLPCYPELPLAAAARMADIVLEELLHTKTPTDGSTERESAA